MSITVRVRDAMDTDVVFIDAEKTVMDALNKMLKSRVWSLVVEKRGLPIGVVTERDTIRRCISKGTDPKRRTVEEIMSSPLVTIDPDVPIGEAMKLMVEKDIRRVYVIDDGKIIGRVTQTGAFKHMLDVVRTLSSIPYQL